MGTDVQLLFDEFATRYARGEDPNLREFLSRAGADADALARLVDGFLAGSPPPASTPERVETMRAWVRGEPPLLELRKQRRLRRSDVVARLADLLGLPEARHEKLAWYYHRLESGLLELRRIDERVWEALREVFGDDVRALAHWRPAPAHERYAYRMAAAKVDSEYVPPEPEREEDEVDRLFLSGS
ncbi:MAG: hypothetical protein ACRDNB_03815 [Gaiellaceae bacterium]